MNRYLLYIFNFKLLYDIFILGDDMMEIFMYIASGIIIISFICYGLLIIFNNKKISEDNGFNITKDIISEYDSINIVENTGIITYYNPKRGVIRLSSRCYYGNNLSLVAISLLEAGISVVDKHKNKYLNIFKIVFSNIKWLYIFPIVVSIINMMTYTVGDVKLGIILVVISTVISYMFIAILSEAFNWIVDNIKKIKVISKDNRDKVINYINNIIGLNKLMFLGELLVIIRMVAVLLYK